MSKLKSSLLALVQNKWFCLFWLVFGFLYFTIYGMLYVEDLYTEGLRSVNVFGFLLEPTMTATASIIGKTYFWGFKGWGLFQAIAISLNVLYAYRKYGYATKFAKAGKILLIAGAVCIAMCVMIRSTEEPGLQRFGHWAGALLFAFFDAVALGFVIAHLAKKEGIAAKGTLAFFIAMLALMLGLLIFVGKSGAIETIPMWGAFIILYLLNFTNLYKKYLPAVAETGEPA